MNKDPCVYILASRRNGTLYIGVTSDLLKRIYQHREGLVDGFSKNHDCKILAYYEQLQTMEDAILREKQMKKWDRLWKLRVIEVMNPYWKDLYYEIRD